MFHTVVALEHGTVTVWQAQLLAWSFKRAGEPGPLTLIEAGEADTFDHGDVFRTLNYRYPFAREYPEAVKGDQHPVFNRLYGLRDWLADDGPKADTILIVDADFVWFRRSDLPDVEPGAPISQDWSSNPFMAEFVAKYGGQPIGVPLLMHREDLERFVPRAIERMHAVRDASAMGNQWMDEMGGFNLAAQLEGIEFNLEEIDDGSILHYYEQRPCISSGPGSPGFYKSRYTPWTEAPVVGPPSARLLAYLINEYAETHSHASRR